MQINRGCGCLMLPLAFFNMLFVVVALMVAGQAEINFLFIVVMVGVFLGNAVVIGMVGLAAIRRRPIEQATSLEEGDIESVSDSEIPQEGED